MRRFVTRPLRGSRAAAAFATTFSAACILLLTTCQLDELTSPGELGRVHVTELSHLDSARLGSTATRVRTATLTVTGATASLGYAVSVQGASSWLRLSATTGSAPGSLSMTLDPAGLALGEHRDTLVFTGEGPDAVPVRVGVTFRIIGCRIDDIAVVPATVTAELTTADCASPRLPGRFARHYRFTGAADDSVTLQATSAAYAPSIAISPAAALVPAIDASSDCSVGPESGNACLRYLRLPAAGQYLVEVTSVAAGATGAHTLVVGTPRAPVEPASLVQETTADPAVGIAVGGSLAATSLRLRATLADADLDSMRLEVELRPSGEAFTGVATATGAWVSGGSAAADHAGLVDDEAYHWRARAVDATGRTSDWVEFGSNATGAADFTVSVAESPLAPSALNQARVDGTTPIAAGGVTNESSVVLRASVNDPDPADQVRLEVELRAVGVPFTGQATASSGFVATGSVASVSQDGLADDVGYRWRARAVDVAGNASAWMEFGTGDAADFVVALPPTQLAFIVGPSNVAAGTAITPGVRVAAQGASGATRTSFSGVITLSLGSNTAGGTLGGSLSVGAVDGVALFADLSLDIAGAYTLVATAGALDVTSASFTVGAGAAQSLAFITSPASGVAGLALTPAPQVQVRDAQGNVDGGFAGPVTIALGSDPHGATLGGTTTVAAVAGVATFSDLSIDRAGAGYTLAASANGLSGAQGGQLEIVAGAAAALELVTQPASSASSGNALATQPVVRLLDAFDNAVAQASVLVTASLASGPSGATLLNATAMTGADGVATFAGLAITGNGGAYTLAFAASGLTGATSGSVTLGAGAASRLAMVAQPPAVARNDALFSSSPVVRLLDGPGNVVPSAGVPVTVSIASGGGALGGTATVLTAADGTATFDELSITGTIGARTLQFESPGLTPVTSAAVTLTAGDATQMERLSADVQSAQAGANVTAPPSVRVRDVSGNPVSGIAVTFSVTAGGGSVAPTAPVATNAAGIATLTSWTLGLAAGANAVEASVDGLAGSPVTLNATGTAGVATAIVVAGGDDLTAPIGSTLGTAHEVRVVDANGNPVAGVAVAWAAIGGGSVNPSLSVSGADGIASAIRTLGNTAGAQSTTATASVAGGTASVTFDIIATTGGASQMALVGGDAQVATVGTALPQPLAVQVRDSGNNPVAGVLITWAVIDGGGSVNPATSLTNASGIATTSWTLGTVTTPVDSTQLARATGVGSPVNFVATSRPGAVSASQTLVGVAPASVGASRNAPVTVTVTARDQFANPVPGRGVVLAASGTGNTLTQPVGVTNASGVATGAFGSTTTGAHTISATVDALPAVQQPVVTIVPAPASRIAFVTPPSDVVAGAAIAPPIALELLDSLGNRASTSAASVTLSLATNPGAALLGGTVTRSAIAGVATFPDISVNRAAAGYQLSANAGGLSGVVSPEFAVAVGTVSAARSSVSALPGSVAAGVGSTITVTARDANDNPVAGALVTLAATGAGNSIAQPVGLTDAAGIATGTVSSTVVGAKTVTATVGGVEVTQAATVTVVPATVSASESGITALPASISADGGSSIITVTARDAFGNVIPGVPVVLAATGELNTLTQPAAVTSALGVATGSLSSSRAGARTVSATIGGVTIAATASVTVGVGNASATHSTLIAGSTALVAGAPATAITVTVLDANDNPVPGVAVVLSATGDGNTIVQPAAVTGANGVAVGSFASTTAGAKTVTATAGAVAVTQASVITVSPAAVSAARSSVSAAPLTVAPGAPSTISVVARDAFDNPVPGAAVVLAATGSSNSISQPAATAADGTTSGTISSTVAEPKVISATVDGVLVTETAAVTVTAGAISGTESTIETAPGSVVAGTETSTITVTARDASGNVVPGVEVVLSATGTGNSLVQPVAVTDVNGVATGTIASTRAESKTISTTVGGVSVAPSATVLVVPAAISPAQSLVELSTAVISAGVGSATVTVTVRDEFLNAVPGVAVVLAATGDGNDLVQPPAVTNALGVATGSITSTVSEAKTITASAGGVPLTAAPVLTVTPDAPSGALSTLELSAPNVAAGVDVTVTVTARDASGNAIQGVTVAIAGTGTGNVIVQPAVTGADGVATGTFRSTVAEAKTITATVNGVAVEQSGALAVAPAPISAATSTVVSSAPTLVAGAPAVTITVTVRDEFGNPVPGAAVVLASAEGALTQPAAVTDAAGVATGSYASTVVGAKSVSATADATGITQTAAIAVTPAAISPTLSTVAADPASLVAGGAAATVTVTARDVHGNLVPDATVTLAATGTGNTLTTTAITTDANGVGTGSFASTVAELKEVTATIDGVAVTAGAAITVVAGAANGTESTLLPSSAQAAAGEEVSVTVTARDASGNLIQGATVVIAVSGDAGSLTVNQPVGPTSALGTATGTFTSTLVGSRTVSATVNGEPVALPQDVVVTPAAISAAQSLVVVEPASIAASAGAVTATVTVTVRDQFLNPIPGVTVTLGASGTGNTVTGPVGVTDASGVASGSVSSTVPGDKTITATADATPLTTQPTLTVTAGAVDAAQSTVAVSSASAVADEALTVTVTARDALGNAVPGAAVVVNASGTGNTIGLPPATDANGVSTVTFSSTVAESKTISATAGAIPIAQEQVVSVTAGLVSADSSTIRAVPSSIQAVSGSSTITVTARDAFGNPVADSTVVMSVVEAGASVAQDATVSDVAGQVTGTLTATTVGTKTVRATIGGVLIDSIAEVTVSVGAVSAANSTLSASLENTTVGTDVTITVTARDAGGNPVAGQSVVVTAAGADSTFVSDPVLTNALGVATATFSSTHAELRAVSATIAEAPIAATTNVTFAAGPLSVTESSVVPASATMTAGGPAIDVVVTARDAFGNPLAGLEVELTVDAGTLTQPATTDASGVATGTFTSTLAGQRSISAAIGGQPRPAPAIVTVLAGAPSVGTSTSVASAPTVAAGGTVSITVTARDASGNLVEGAAVALVSTGTGVDVTQASGVTDVNGSFVAQVSSELAQSVEISTTLAGTVSLTAVALEFVPGATTALQFSVPPTDVIAGVAVSPSIVVAAVDQFGNATPAFTGEVVLTIAPSTGVAGAAIITPSNATVAAVAGVATFGGIAIDSAGAGYELVASATGITGAQSAAFSVTPAAASQLAFPALAATFADGALIPDFVVVVRDAFGNQVTDHTGDVTIELIDINANGGTLNGTLAVPLTAGVATFSGLSVTGGPGPGYTLRVTATGLASAESTIFEVTPVGPLALASPPNPPHPRSLIASAR